MSDLDLDPTRTALLVMDFQVGILARLGDAQAALLDRVVPVVEAARARKMLVGFVVVGFRPGHPEIGDHATFSAIKQGNLMIIGDEPTSVHPRLAPRAGEPIIVKRRVSAFAGSDLEVILRAQKIEQLVLAGVSTSGVVLSTTRQAADADYRLVIAEDGCADPDDEVHRVLTTKVLARQARMTSCESVVAALRGHAG